MATKDQNASSNKPMNASFTNSFYLYFNKPKVTNMPKSVTGIDAQAKAETDIKIKSELHFPVIEKNKRSKQLTEAEKIEIAKNDTHLKQSRIVESQNKNLLIVMWICISPMSRILQLLVRYLRGIVTMNDIFNYVNKPVVQIVLYIAVSFLVISLFIHRLLGAIVGIILRSYLRKSVVNKTGRYDIHFGWISYRGIFDLNQILIRDFMWRNPPEFEKTPYLIRCKAIAISFSLPVLINMILNNFNKIVLGEILIDSLEVYFERGSFTFIQ